MTPQHNANTDTEYDPEFYTIEQTKQHITDYCNAALNALGCTAHGDQTPSVTTNTDTHPERGIPVAGIGSNHHPEANDASHDLINLTDTDHDHDGWATISYHHTSPSQSGSETLVWEHPPTIREINLAETVIENAYTTTQHVRREKQVLNLRASLWSMWGENIDTDVFTRVNETSDVWLPGEQLNAAVGPNATTDAWHNDEFITGLVEYEANTNEANTYSDRVIPTTYDAEPGIEGVEYAWSIDGNRPWVFARTDDGVGVYAPTSFTVEDVTITHDGTIKWGIVDGDGDLIRGGFKSVCVPEAIPPDHVIDLETRGTKWVLDNKDVEQKCVLEHEHVPGGER